MEYTKEIHDEIEGIFKEKKSLASFFEIAGYCLLTIAEAIWLGEFYPGESETLKMSTAGRSSSFLSHRKPLTERLT
jgi:hypothetical protein